MHVTRTGSKNTEDYSASYTQTNHLHLSPFNQSVWASEWGCLRAIEIVIWRCTSLCYLSFKFGVNHLSDVLICNVA